MDDPMATGNFVNFTLPELPGSGAADAPMATVNFVNFRSPTGRMAAEDRASVTLTCERDPHFHDLQEVRRPIRRNASSTASTRTASSPGRAKVCESVSMR